MPNDQQQPNAPQRPAEQQTPSEPPKPNASVSGEQQQSVTPNGSPDPKQPQQQPAPDQQPSSPAADSETFPRQYVEELRQENARYRTEAKAAETLGQRLHVELVKATGKLADPTDMPFDAAHLDDPDALAAAIDALIEAKPHLKARRIVGDVGQGTGSASDDAGLLGMLRARA